MVLGHARYIPYVGVLLCVCFLCCCASCPVLALPSTLRSCSCYDNQCLLSPAMTFGCMPLLPPDHGTMSCTSGNTPSSTCTVTCDAAEGWKRDGSASRTCTDSGVAGKLWSGTPNTCTGTFL